MERGWFDEVQLLFGPVGHTHNGNDGVHYVHNRLAGNYVSGTLAHYVNHFHHAWATDVTRPDAALLDCQYDWDKHYAIRLNKLAGFTKTSTDPK